MASSVSHSSNSNPNAPIPSSGEVSLPILNELRQIVGGHGLLTSPVDLHTYECDGLTNFRVMPRAVLLPDSAEQVQAIVRVCHRERIPFVARGSGTGLSGGALPVSNGIVLSLARMNRILEVDLPNGRVVVEPGVINLDVTGRVSPSDYFYAPDPSSQSVCTVGGNVAENAGGLHCLKYGFTTTHVLGLEVVLPDGSLVHIGSKALDMPGYDLAGVFVGSEGTLGIATKITLRVIKRAECIHVLMAAFDTTNHAGAAVSDIIAAGLYPAAMEMMDALSIEATEAAVHANYPKCGGLLLVELDGPTAEVEVNLERVEAICRQNGAWEIRLAKTAAERALIWKGRKAAFAAMGRISPNYIVQDGVIPRTSLPEVMDEINRMSAEAGLRVANVFHAGDGNLHPLVLYDARIPGQEEAAEGLSIKILQLCIDKGGSITGEHGVGEEKKQMMSKMFSEPDLETMQRVRCAFDPLHLSNPSKVFPRPRLCGEKPGRYTPHPLEAAGIAERY
ncbi:MAG TPA: FAD-linked oxidase C-terminal domain-containing protein [Acidobacteriaceae bacterium]|nr:FAD-linked oxidase C-terminal domain-containing protein [Acidobacteriaceae bacterium]